MAHQGRYGRRLSPSDQELSDQEIAVREAIALIMSYPKACLGAIDFSVLQKTIGVEFDKRNEIFNVHARYFNLLDSR